jgi:hypothetical protein
VADPTPPEKIPYAEWFDYRPIPAITGPNSTDPTVLGVDEYVKKGLIKPPTEEKKEAEQSQEPQPTAPAPLPAEKAKP